MRSASSFCYNEGELSVMGVWIVFGSAATISILAPVRWAVARVPRRGGDYLPIGELLPKEIVQAALTRRGEAAESMLRTRIWASLNALISSDFSRTADNRRSLFCRFNLEQLKEYVKHWWSSLIRTEEEPKLAGEPS